MKAWSTTYVELENGEKEEAEAALDFLVKLSDTVKKKATSEEMLAIDTVRMMLNSVIDEGCLL